MSVNLVTKTVNYHFKYKLFYSFAQFASNRKISMVIWQTHDERNDTIPKNYLNKRNRKKNCLYKKNVDFEERTLFFKKFKPELPSLHKHSGKKHLAGIRPITLGWTPAESKTKLF